MSLVRHAGYLVGLQAASLVAGAVANVIVARTLGAEGKGVVYLAFLVPQFLASIGGFGLRSAATYFTGRGADVRGLVRRVFLAGLLFGLGYVALGFLLQDLLAATILDGLEMRWIHLSILLVPVTLLWAFADGVIQGLRRFGLYTGVQTLSLVLRVAGLAGLLILLDGGTAGAMAAYAGATVLPGLLAVGVALTLARPGGTAVGIRELLGYGLRVQLGTVAQRANLSLDVFLINPYLGTAQVGLYSVAVMLAQLAWYVPGAFGQALFPVVSGSRAEEAAETSARLGRMVVLITLPTLAALAAVAPWAVPLVFGEEFRGSLPALYGLMPGILAQGVAMILAQYLAGVGLPQRNSLASLVALGVNLPALFLLVPRWGILGAALASSLAYGTQAALVCAFFARRSGRGWSSFLVPRGGDVREILGRIRNRGRAPETPHVP